MKSKKPISIRFDENDLLLAQNLSGIKKPQKLVDALISEYVKSLKPKLLELPKDYMNVTDVRIFNGTSRNLKIPIPPRPMGYGHPIADKIEAEDYNAEIQSQIDALTAEMDAIKEGNFGTPLRNKLLDKITKLKRQL